jgi:SAM-dependent methyltransferase
MTSTPEFNQYYGMWVDKMGSQASPSLAIHYGYDPDPANPLDHDWAKVAATELVADTLGLSPDEEHTLADLGCGVGGPARYMSHRFPLAKIMAVNVHAPQLELMVSLPPKPSERIVPVVADFMDLGLPDNSLDGAYAIESSCYAPDKPAFYQEVLRQLRVGGRLVITDAFNVRPPETDEERQAYTQSLRGWVVPSWHPAPAEVPGATVEYRNLTPHVMPDVERSFIDSRRFAESDNPVLRGQAEVLAGARAVLNSGIVQYGLLTLTKDGTNS